MTTFTVWPTVRSIPISAVTDESPKTPSADGIAGVSGTGRDTDLAPSTQHSGKQHDRPTRAAEANPADGLGFSGDPEQRGAVQEDMMHAQRLWDGTLAANRLDDAGLVHERQRVETADLTVTAGLLVAGNPDEVRACVEALVTHTTAHVLALDLGDVDGAGTALHDQAERFPDRVTAWHVAERPEGTASWGECRAKLLYLDTADIHLIMDTAAILDRDLVTPLVAEIDRGAAAAAREGFDGLLAVRRSAALSVLPADSAHDFRRALQGRTVSSADSS
ncbi:hypothetical protein ACIBG8_01560 [Nonomuraea sp. NPDC050556]|uniref:hypothetical protein n=1 Tax=Nonomuraea sp. NPDC050556 TaxID=3364369 RepID=UPI0037AE8571